MPIIMFAFDTAINNPTQRAHSVVYIERKEHPLVREGLKGVLRR
jgi:hypothetical protein